MATLSLSADVLFLHFKIILHSTNFKNTQEKTKCEKKPVNIKKFQKYEKIEGMDPGSVSLNKKIK